MGRRDKRVQQYDSSDDEDFASPSRKDWVREIHRNSRASGRVFEPDSKPVPTPSRAPAAQAAPAAAATAPAASEKKDGAVVSGMLAFAVTPCSSGGIDRDFVADYAAALKADGASGAICGGLASEVQLLSVNDRKALFSAWSSTGLAFVADVTASAFDDTAALVAHAQSCGAKALLVAEPGAMRPVSADDAASHIADVCRLAPSTSVLYYYTPASYTAAAVLRAVSSRAANLKGCLFGGCDTTDLAACQQILKASGGTLVAAEGSQFAAAAAQGVTAFASVHNSTICPLFTKIIAAAGKGDAATLGKLMPLCATYYELVSRVAAGSCAREVAVAKAIASFRLERDFGHVRQPGPRLTVLEVQQLRTGMEAFVKAYSAAVGASAGAAPAGGSKINMPSMPGYQGKLDDKIRERALECGRAAGVRNILDSFPHLGRTWRGTMPGRNCDLSQFIDHTVLKPECTAAEITKLTTEAKKHKFYAVCVNGCRVRQCMDELAGTSVKVAAVIGFPLGAMTSKAKAREAREIVQMGASEIDMVMNVGAMRDGDLRRVYEDVKAVVDASRPAIVKVIFETCLLTADQIMDASILSVAAGAGFLKTSTGFNKGGATPEAIDIMLAVAGNECQTKASGGVRTAPDALAYVCHGVTRIGTSSGIAIMTGAASAGGY